MIYIWPKFEKFVSENIFWSTQEEAWVDILERVMEPEFFTDMSKVLNMKKQWHTNRSQVNTVIC